MTEYICTYMPWCESKLFTEGHVYPVVEVRGPRGNVEVVLDNYGFERYLLKDDKTFIVQNDHYRGSVYRAEFERRQS